MSFPKHFKQGTVKRPRDCRWKDTDGEQRFTDYLFI